MFIGYQHSGRMVVPNQIQAISVQPSPSASTLMHCLLQLDTQSMWSSPIGSLKQAMFIHLCVQTITGTSIYPSYPCCSIEVIVSGTSLVAQWLRIHLPMQGTQVRALVREDPTCRGETKPMRHNYWACAPRACAPQEEKPWQWEARAPQLLSLRT